MERIPPSPRLDARDLRLVLALAGAGTTARAAALLHLTQPAVSRALLGAEGRLGTRLFERTPRGLVPTEAGRRLVEGAPGLLAALGDLEHRVRAPAPAPTRLRLVCECYTAYHWLPTVLAGLRRSLPELRVALELRHTEAPVPALERGDIDVALLTTSAVPRGLLGERPAFSDEVLFLVAASHPLAARRVLRPADLKQHPLLTGRTPPAAQQWFLTRVFGRQRPPLRVEVLPITEAVVEMARAGLGVAVLSEWIAQPHLGQGGLVPLRLATGPLQRPWRLAWRPEVADAAARLLPALQATAPRRLLAG